jgi:hypothetical protein
MFDSRRRCCTPEKMQDPENDAGSEIKMLDPEKDAKSQKG